MDPQLLKAVSTGDADLLAQILSTSTDHACLEGVTGEGNSALHIAARHGYLTLVEKICERVSLIKARNNLLDTPLICAARAGHVDVVDHLIHLACNQPETRYVLRAWNSSGATAVHEAVRNGHESVLEKLLSRDASLAAVVDGQGVSPLYMAAVSNRIDMVHILISESREEGTVRSPASYAGPDGLTALHAAVFATNAQEMCESLQRWEPTLVQKADSSGRTALHYAASAGKTGVVKVLLDNNLLCYIPDDDGLYPVHYAAVAGNDKVIREIMEICPSCDELVDKKHRNILHCAVEFGRIKVVWYICKNPKFTSIMNAGDGEGSTPLHLAIKHGHFFIFFLLTMDPRVNLSITNHKGFTPLDVTWKENTHTYSFSVFMIAYMRITLWLCKAYPVPFNLDRKLRYNDCLLDENESSRFSDVSQSMLCLSALIAAGSFAAAFTPPRDYITKGKNVGMTLFDTRSPFLLSIEANSISFYLSAIATCLLIHASLATTPIRRRRVYLQSSALLVFGAVFYMFTTFTNVVRLTLEPQKDQVEWFIVYFITLVVHEVTNLCMHLWVLLFAIPLCIWVSRTSKHPSQDRGFKLVAAVASVVIIYKVCHSIPYVMAFIRFLLQPGKQESCSWPGCRDAIFLHPT